MIKFYETVTNARGDSLPNYRVAVVDSDGATVIIYADGSGTRFTDGAGNIVNYTTASVTGKAEFYWTPATGQVLQILDINGELVDATADFADKYVLANLPGEVAQSAVTDLVGDLAAKDTAIAAVQTDVDANEAALAASGGSALVGYIASGTGAVARTAQAKLQESLSVFDFIPVAEHAAIIACTSTTDVTSYITSAITKAMENSFGERRLVFPAGKYSVSQLSVKDKDYLHLHAEGTVQIVGNDDAQGFIFGSNRYDLLADETYTDAVRLTGGPWLIAPAAGETYQRGVKLQNLVNCEFENVSVSGTYTPSGGTGDRIAVEIQNSFDNAYHNWVVGSPGAPIGSDKTYLLHLGQQAVNNNHFYNFRGAGSGGLVANVIGVRPSGVGNAFFGADISAVHTVFELYFARGFQALNTYHESISCMVTITFASGGCTFLPSLVDIYDNGTGWDLSGAENKGFTIIGGPHKYGATGTTGIKKGSNTYGLTYLPSYEPTPSLPATASTGTDRGSGGLNDFNAHEITAAKINFPDTAVASSNATTLDCYKENNLTSYRIAVGATTQTSSSIARETKIGRNVTIEGYVLMGGAVSGTGDLTITGLTYAATGLPAVALTVNGVTFTGQYSAYIDGSVIKLYQTSEAGTRSALTEANLGSGSEIEFMVSYAATS